ncbi:MAG: PIN domain-containing protein [Clostridia bacterium]|nr:PIN domain-containing protein [Clostridia bacterium]
MMLAVYDTNVLVSAFWTPQGKASALLREVISGKITLCYDARMMFEYKDVLLRPKFKFSESMVSSILDYIESSGLSVTPPAVSDVQFPDETDRAFFEVARFCSAPLVTGNLKHYPVHPMIITIADFYDTHILHRSDTASSKVLQAQSSDDNVPLRPFGETQDALKQNVFTDAEDRAEIERLGGKAR